MRDWQERIEQYRQPRRHTTIYIDTRSRAIVEVVDGAVVVFGPCSSDDLPFHIEWRHDRIVKL